MSVVGIEVEKTENFALFDYAKKERVLKCMEVASRGCTMSFGSSTLTSWPESPIGVLETAILSHKTDDKRRLNNISL
ncbi:uncharacterized protein LOC143617216 [Bidens hawaiensis]|uniref:uncharacterized protein LOC143617216 n=1 Tax=Bidens hawaiensis TaxID=980011 RepID=UPI00404B7FE0